MLKFIENFSYIESVVQVFGIEDGYESTLTVNGSEVKNNTAVNLLYYEEETSGPRAYMAVQSEVTDIEDWINSVQYQMYSEESGEYTTIFEMSGNDSRILLSYDLPADIDLIENIIIKIEAPDGSNLSELTLGYALLGSGSDYIKVFPENTKVDSSGIVEILASSVSREYLNRSDSYSVFRHTAKVYYDTNLTEDYFEYYAYNTKGSGILLILLKNDSGNAVSIENVSVSIEFKYTSGSAADGTITEIIVN